MRDLSLKTDTSKSRSRSSAWWVMCIAPAVLTVSIIAFAPNWDFGQVDRQDPYGGDFLQEWVGGSLIFTGQTDQLYDLQASRSIQHDADLLGFRWQKDRYFPMVYPPFYYLLCSPMAALPYKTAALVWLALMTLSLAVSLVLLCRLLNGKPFVAAFCLCFPVVISLSTGQKGTLLLLIFTIAIWLLRDRKLFAAGAVFALIAFKPHLAIPLGLVMVWKRQWRFLAGCAVTLSMLLALCATLGIDTCTAYINVCFGLGDYVQTSGYHLEQGFSFWSALQLAINSPAITKIFLVLATVSVLCALFFVFQGEFDPTSDRFLFQFAALIVGTMLIAPHFYTYDLTILILPATLALLAITRTPVRSAMAICFFVCVAFVLYLTGQLIWLTSATGIAWGVVFLCLAFGTLVTWSIETKRNFVVAPEQNISIC